MQGGAGPSAWNVAALRARMSKYEKTLENEDSADATMVNDEREVELALRQPPI